MKDTIYRQDAVEAIDKILPADPMKNEYIQGITCGAALAEEYIKQLPSAQSERKKGKWVHVGFMTVECSECHKQYHELEYDKYCPYCGADMTWERT